MGSDAGISDFSIQISKLLKQLFEEVRGVIENYDDHTTGEKELKKIKDYYYKKKYLLRLNESLDTFASP